MVKKQPVHTYIIALKPQFGAKKVHFQRPSVLNTAASLTLGRRRTIRKRQADELPRANVLAEMDWPMQSSILRRSSPRSVVAATVPFLVRESGVICPIVHHPLHQVATDYFGLYPKPAPCLAASLNPKDNGREDLDAPFV